MRNRTILGDRIGLWLVERIPKYHRKTLDGRTPVNAEAYFKDKRVVFGRGERQVKSEEKPSCDQSIEGRRAKQKRSPTRDSDSDLAG